MYRVITPQTAAELDAYYQLRWELLRKPFNLPVGSERDEYDSVAIHRLMLTEDGTPSPWAGSSSVATRPRSASWRCAPSTAVGAGSPHGGGSRAAGPRREGEAAGDERPPGGGGVLSQVRISRSGEGPVSFGRIPHRQMIKSLSPLQTIQYRPEWCQDLTTRWSQGHSHQREDGVHITHYDGQTFHLKANLAANLNVHDTMFAGSIYSQCVLAGWGPHLVAARKPAWGRYRAGRGQHQIL